MIEREGDTQVVSLWNNTGTSDKMYHMVIEPDGKGTFSMKAFHGPRLKAMKEVPYLSGVSRRTAQSKFNDLYDQKTRKGYKDQPASGPAKEALNRATTAASASVLASVQAAAAQMPIIMGWESDYEEAREFLNPNPNDFFVFSPGLFLFSELSLALEGGHEEALGYLNKDPLGLRDSGLLTPEVRQWLKGLDDSQLEDSWRQVRVIAASR